jgi:hypothetical protein
MLEYVFFNQHPCNAFASHAESKGISVNVNDDDGSFIVTLPEDTNEELLESLEQLYDELIDLDREIEEQKVDDSTGAIHTGGITVTLMDGSIVYANISPVLLSKLLQCIGFQELNTLVDAIAKAVENKDKRSLCQRE